MMSDLISRAAAIEAALDGADEWDGGCNPTREEYIREHMARVPAVDAVPVVHGRWITNKHGETVCSECDSNALQVLTGCLVNRHFEPHKSEFCPNCGAKMDGERRDSE